MREQRRLGRLGFSLASAPPVVSGRGSLASVFWPVKWTHCEPSRKWLSLQQSVYLPPFTWGRGSFQGISLHPLSSSLFSAHSSYFLCCVTLGKCLHLSGPHPGAKGRHRRLPGGGVLLELRDEGTQRK